MSRVLVNPEIKPPVASEKIRNWARDHLQRRGAKNVTLEVRIVGNREITKLNETYLKKSGPTDVLSFPLEKIPGERKEFVGTIVICNNVVRAQAKAQNVSVGEEYQKMVVHGIDHLLGIHHK
jgi:probable rRNA maturation factor